ncbi:MAG: hypothetical protein JWQ34_1742 [Mucilaginibacter sp.]|uniref:hypothetical protein n=1 Tax=Mucilaginibacter sp. TaxID=1882438 RepID=UPI002628B95E|nr:hypothetical protein [Mucilaginibacter sp.]MDB5003517.1 hypothetical protein [Mucilaginibacter sp.]
MHIAYSALQNTNNQTAQAKPTTVDQLSIRFKAYQNACNKYSKEITAIQKYIPGWVPAYPVASPHPFSKGEGL